MRAATAWARRSAILGVALSVMLADIALANDPCGPEALAVLHARLNQDVEKIQAIDRLNTQGLSLKSANRSPEALAPLLEAQALADRTLPPDHVLHVTIRQNLATVEDDQGHLGAALDRLQQALDMTGHWSANPLFLCWDQLAPPDRPRADLQVIATLHNNLGDLLGRMNRHDESLSHWREAVRIRRENRDPLLVNALIGQAVELDRLTRYDEAWPLLEEARREAEDSRDGAPQLPRVLNSQCHILNNTGRAPEAVSLCEEALGRDEAVSGPDSANLPDILSNLAYAYRLTGQAERIGPLLARASAMAEASGRPHLAWQADGNLAWHLRESGNTEAAVALGKRAIEHIQAMRASLGGLEKVFSLDFMQDKYRTYRIVADWLMELGRTEEALQVLDLLRGEEALDFAERGSVPRSASLPISAEERAFLEGFSHGGRQLADAEKRLSVTPQTGAKTKPNEPGQQRALGAQRAAFYRQLSAWRNGGTATGLSPTTIRQAQLHPLPGTAILGYLVADNRIWAYWDEGQGTQVLALDMTARRLQTRLAQLRLAVERPDGAHPEEPLQGLYQELFLPVADRIRARRIALALVDDLRYVPFAALFDGRDYLLHRYTFSYLAPAGKSRPATQPKGSGLAGFGLTRASLDMPALPGVTKELCAIVRGPVHGGESAGNCIKGQAGSQGLIEGEVYFNEAFTPSRLLEKASRRPPPAYLHIATHFQLGALDTESFLYLDRNARMGLDKLRAADFSGLDLLTLSACQTGRVPGGSQFQGFAAYVRERGARNVAASLWRTNDRATPPLMTEFYRQLARPGTRPDQALRAAQLALLDHREGLGRPFAHPYYWAPFLVLGEPE